MRYSHDTTLTLICQACILRIWTSKEPSDFQNKTCKLLPLFVRSMGSPLIVRLYALLCIRCGVRLSERGTLPQPQTRNGPSLPVTEVRGLTGRIDNAYEDTITGYRYRWDAAQSCGRDHGLYACCCAGCATGWYRSDAGDGAPLF